MRSVTLVLAMMLSSTSVYAEKFVSLECETEFGFRTSITIDMDEKVAEIIATSDGKVIRSFTNLKAQLAPSQITITEPRQEVVLGGGVVYSHMTHIHKISRKDLSYLQDSFGVMVGEDRSVTSIGTCIKVEADASENLI